MRLQGDWSFAPTNLLGIVSLLAAVYLFRLPDVSG